MKAKMAEVHAKRMEAAQGLERQIQNHPQRNMNLNPAQQRMIANNMQPQRPNPAGQAFVNPQMQQIPRTSMPMGQQPQQLGAAPGMMSALTPRTNGQMPIGHGAQAGMPMPMPMQTPNFTAQETTIINTMAQQMFASATPQEREMAHRRVVESTGQPQLQLLRQKQVNLVQWFFRQMAVKRYLAKKQEAQNLQQQGQNGGNAFGAAMLRPGNAAQNLVNAPASQIGIASQQLGNLGGNFQQIMSRQENGLREQEAGRMVVPASQQHIAGQPGMNQQTGQTGGQNPQQQIGNPQNIQSNTGSTATSGQVRQANSQNHVQQQQPLQGQPGGGLRGPLGQGMPQQSPAMPTLNRPMDSNTPRPASQTQQKPQQQTPDQNAATTGKANQSLQQAGQGQSQMSTQPQAHNAAPKMANLQAIINGFPPHIRQQLMNLPPESRNQFLAKLRSAQLQKTGQTRSQNSQGQTKEQLSEKLSAGSSISGQAHELSSALNATSINGPHLTKEQIEEMDNQPYPPTILNGERTMRHIPPDVKTWRALKEWCRSHSNIVPPESITKLDHLQAMHFSMLAKRGIAIEGQALRQNLPGQQLGGQPVPNVTASQSGPAPMATMAPPRSTQALGPAQWQQMLASHPLLQVSDEEVRMIRASLPPNAAHLSNAELKVLVAKRKVQQLNGKAMMNGQTPPFPQFVSPTQPTKTQSQQGRQGLPNLATPTKDEKTASQTQPQARAQQVPKPQKPQGSVGSTEDRIQKTSSSQGKNDKIAQQKSSPAQSQQVGQPRDPKAMRYKQIQEEIKGTLQTGPTIPMDDKTRAFMAHLLEKNIDFMKHSEMGVFQHYNSIDPSENALREAERDRQMLLKQYKDDQKTPAPQFTMTVKDTYEKFQKLRLQFVAVTDKRKKEKAAALGPLQPSTPQGSQTATMQSQQSQPAATAQPMLKQPSKQKHTRDKDPPPAPTTHKPPYPLGASPPPHGIPTYGQSVPELTQDKLALPPAKKRKLGPGQEQSKAAASTAARGKQQFPQQTNLEGAFKCSVPGCERAKKGFMTIEALAQHIEEAHKEKDPENPLAFALEQARHALGLDDNGKAAAKDRPAKMEKSLSAQPMKQSLSAQGPTPKLEGGTPMSRGTTHMSSLGAPRTPQPVGKLVESKGTPKSSQGRAGPATPSREPVTPDPWNDIDMTPQDLASQFPTLADVQGSLGLSGLTPASTLATKSDKNTPKSDIGEDASIKINIDADSWLPPGFMMDCYDQNIDTSFANDDVLAMDWDTVFSSSTDAKQRGKKRDPDDAFRTDLFSLNFGIS